MATRRKPIGLLRLLLITSLITAALAGPNPLFAQVVTDGTFGDKVTLNGPDLQIPETLGTIAGQNLFHSFETFSIESGEVAIFTGNSNIQNVVSRVTGGEVSNIQGELRSEVGNADFYFINPAGVTFGEDATVDVPASFHLSTAEQLVFSDDTILDATTATNTLSIAAPREFGFLGNGAGAGAIEFNGAEIEITSGDLNVAGYSLSINDAQLLNSAGDINVEVQGEVLIENTGQIRTTTTNKSDAGNIFLSANQLDINGQGSNTQTGIASETDPEATGNVGSIDVSIAGLTTIQNGGAIRSSGNALLYGAAGNISLSSNQLVIDGQGSETGIFSDVFGTFRAIGGTIDINVFDQATILDGGLIRSATFSQANAGTVLVTANQLVINGVGSNRLPTGIASDSGSSSQSTLFNAGEAGTVDVTVSEQTIIQNGGVIQSASYTGGYAGFVRLTSGQLLIDGQGSESPTGINADTPTGGSPGTVDIHIADLARIENGGEVSSSASADQENASGGSGAVFFMTNRLEINGPGSGIFNRAAGTVDVTVFELATISNGGLIATDIQTEGNAGAVRVSANRLIIDGGEHGNEFNTGISSSSNGDQNSSAGKVEVLINQQASIQNGGAISSVGGGDVAVVSSQGNIELINNGAVTSAAATTSNGSVSISTGGTLTINDASVSTESGTGVELGSENDSTFIFEDSRDSIIINAGTLIATNALITSDNSDSGNGGNIEIESDMFVLQNTFIQANNEGNGGGDITINSDAIIPFGNQLNAQSAERLLPNTGQGNVFQAVSPNGLTVSPTVSAPNIDISAALSELGADTGSQPAVASDPCARFKAGAPSSLIETGRGALPVANSMTRHIQLPTSTAQASLPKQRYASASGDKDATNNETPGCRQGFDS